MPVDKGQAKDAVRLHSVNTPEILFSVELKDGSNFVTLSPLAILIIVKN